MICRKIFKGAEDDLLQGKVDDDSSADIEVIEPLNDLGSEDNLNDTFFSSVTKFVCEYTGFFC